jgi:AhpD family alkylhydroperoxidase
METRVNVSKTHPEAYKAMYGLSASLNKSSLTPIQKHLITIRASQLNACAFCLNMHTKESLDAGETQQRIFVLNAWRETDLFTAEEKAMLTLVEEVTLISQHGVSDQTYKNAQSYFSDEAIGDIIMSTVLINAWNRIAVSTHLPIV